MSTPRTYTVPEVSELLGIKLSTLYQQVREGRAGHLRPIRVGTVTRFPRAHIDDIAPPTGGEAA